MKIAIPSPCHEPWQNMQPTQRGAFCEVCSKEVVDFTCMTDDEVRNYFLNGNNHTTCGRFKRTQLSNIAIEIPLNILQKKIACWKKFLAIVMISFGTMLFGCEVKTGKALAITEEHSKGESEIDTIEMYESTFAGGIVIIEESILEENTCPVQTETISFTLPVIIQDSEFANTVISSFIPDTTLIKKEGSVSTKNDSANIKQKIPTDSSTCGDDIIYSK